VKRYKQSRGLLSCRLENPYSICPRVCSGCSLGKASTQFSSLVLDIKFPPVFVPTQCLAESAPCRWTWLLGWIDQGERRGGFRKPWFPKPWFFHNPPSMKIEAFRDDTCSPLGRPREVGPLARMTAAFEEDIAV